MTTVTLRFDDETKEQLDEMVDEMGMNLTTFFMIYAKKSLRDRCIPFEITAPVPNAETRAALAEVADMKLHPENYKGYTDVDEMFRELLA